MANHGAFARDGNYDSSKCLAAKQFQSKNYLFNCAGIFLWWFVD
ncbi:Hypothetical protein ADU72_0848 [Pediococcus damnosus]|uniref:Uncharacterized protein n=1 Tax=Pediococcus damnosus TaxID=51663 RepID=A0ABN4N8E1_9LACO|nr:Hypothetical protein ADU72_0848 [Pediococcus damnosus]